MMGMLASGGNADIDSVTRMVALVSDPESAKSRLGEIHAEVDKANERIERAERKERDAEEGLLRLRREAAVVTKEAGRILESAQKLMREAEDAKARQKQTDASLNARENALAVSEVASQERAAAVAKQLDAKAEIVRQSENALDTRIAAADKRLREREEAVAARETDVASKLKAADALIQQWNGKLRKFNELAQS